MKPHLSLSLLIFAFLQQSALTQTAAVSSNPPLPPAHPALSSDYGKLPLSFEPNQGQTDPQVRFLSRGKGYSLFLTDSAAVLTLARPEAAPQPDDLPPAKGTHALPPVKTDVVRMELVGASHPQQIGGAELLPGTANYYLGHDASSWHTGIPTFARVTYTNVYPGVDLAYYGNQQHLEYDFIVSPSANPNPYASTSPGRKDSNLTPTAT